MTERIRNDEFPSGIDFLFVLLAGITGVAGSYAVAGYTRRFVVAPIDDAVVRLTPGEIVAFVIQNVGEQGHLLHIGLSVLIATGLFASAATVGLYVARRVGRPAIGSGLAGILTWSMVASITADPVLAVGAAGPVTVLTAVGAAPLSASGTDPSRRRVLVSSAGALAFIGISLGLGRLVTTTDIGTQEIDEEVSTLIQEAEEKSLDVRGDIPGLVSSLDEFYNVDIATFDPAISPEDWSLTITGEVGDDVTITFDELADMPIERRFITLRCVGESLNGKKLDNAVWTGTPIKPLLAEADPGGKCGCAMLHAADDYFVQFPIEALEDGFLAWEMNGRPLPQSHGHPVRILIPGHWGETNVKWLTEIELLNEEMDGYWEQRGWHGTGPVNTVAKLWSDSTLDNGNIEVVGHAYAGTRGIESVEVSTNGGKTWQDAELSEPIPGNDVWRQWRYEFEADGAHDVIVRAIDGEGTTQPEEPSDAFPSGATGWVSKTIGG
ncbi:molybdopterin-binding oxidoreductase [Halostagnicola sp. A56]|nr:molybdopterin-binding oxidoreductase [Halostagnicola sp. A56]